MAARDSNKYQILASRRAPRSFPALKLCRETMWRKWKIKNTTRIRPKTENRSLRIGARIRRAAKPPRAGQPREGGLLTGILLFRAWHTPCLDQRTLAWGGGG